MTSLQPPTACLRATRSYFARASLAQRPAVPKQSGYAKRSPSNDIDALHTNRQFRAQHRRSHLRPERLQTRANAAEEQVTGEPERDSCPPQGCLEDLEVADIMSSPAISVRPTDSVYSAMDLMVEKNISGIPVVDEDNLMLGIVSGYDLLALDSTPGRLDDTIGFFPPIGRCKQLYGGDTKQMWKDFNAMQNALRNARGQSVGEAMHEAVTVTPDTSIITAANRIVQRKLNRLVVVDHDGKLAGILSRGDIMRATMAHFRWQMILEEAAEGRGESLEIC